MSITDSDIDIDDANDSETALRYTCLKCATENMLAPPRGCRFAKTSAPKRAATERAVKIATRCASCGHAQEIEPLGWRLVKLTQQERSRGSEGEVARAFKEVYKRNLALRGSRETPSP